MLCFVLPHSFLLSKSASGLRQDIARDFSIRVLADLSEVPVFEQMGSYVILLVAEQTTERHRPATRGKCHEFVGAAHQTQSPARAERGQGIMSLKWNRERSSARWKLLRPDEEALRKAIETHPAIERYVAVRQGVVTGCDEVFIRPSRDCPKGERGVWLPLLPDREMLRFGVPDRQTAAVFMPFDTSGKKLEEAEIRRRYPDTWAYLNFAKGSARPATSSDEE